MRREKWRKLNIKGIYFTRGILKLFHAELFLFTVKIFSGKIGHILFKEELWNKRLLKRFLVPM